MTVASLDKIIFNNDDFRKFRNWINLNIENITWQSRYSEDFEDFWNLFFIDGLSLSQINERFQYAYREIELGPLVNWFKWLNERFLIYTFIFREATLWQLAQDMNIHITRVASVLRDFFVEANPHLDDFLNNLFQITKVTDAGLKMKFEDLVKMRELSQVSCGSFDHEIMPSMEITLYEEFRDFLSRMKKDLYRYELDLKHLENRNSWKKYGLFILETAGLVFVGVVVIGIILKVNIWQSDSISKRISIYNLQIPWISETYKISEDIATVKKELNPEIKNFKNVQPVGQKMDIEREINESVSFGTESDVVLTSWDTLPKNFGQVELEMSSYEEESKGVFRETQFGNRTVYRVIVNSVDAQKTRSEINLLLDKFQVTQADNVKPGTYVPGGVYYNLFVPKDLLKDFLKKVDEVGDAVIYENNSRVNNPPGKNKVFVWIKSL